MTIFSADESMVCYSADQDKSLNPEETKLNAEKVLSTWHRDTVQVIDRKSIIPGSYSAEVQAGWAFGSGKGLTAAQARASAAMECIERLSWLDFDYENAPGYRYASYNDLLSEGLPLVPDSYFFMNFTKESFILRPLVGAVLPPIPSLDELERNSSVVGYSFVPPFL